MDVTLIKPVPGVDLLYSTNARAHTEFFNPKPQDFVVHTKENSCKSCFACWGLAQIEEFHVQAAPQ